MAKKIAKYPSRNGVISVEYDPAAPCRMCGFPVIEASMGGTDVCSWCDLGCNRHGQSWIGDGMNRWTVRDTLNLALDLDENTEYPVFLNMRIDKMRWLSGLDSNLPI